MSTPEEIHATRLAAARAHPYHVGGIELGDDSGRGPRLGGFRWAYLAGEAAEFDDDSASPADTAVVAVSAYPGDLASEDRSVCLYTTLAARPVPDSPDMTERYGEAVVSAVALTPSDARAVAALLMRAAAGADAPARGREA